MKLLAKTNIYISITTVSLMLIAMTIVYLLVLNKIKTEGDEHLLVDKERIVELIEEHDSLQYFSSNVGEKVTIKEIPKQTVFENQFSEYQEEAEEGEEGENEFNFRQLLFQTTVNGKCFEVTVSHSLSESNEIGEYIALIIVLFLVLTLVILIVLNRYISRFIWAPFYQMLVQLRSWTFRDSNKIIAKETNIDEFIELNQAMNMFIQKIQSDYVNLKEFTENISHETQTPTAVISAKLEMLLQEGSYTEKQKQLLMDAYSSTLRLKKLNQTLVTLTRIERGVYTVLEKTDIKLSIEEKLSELAEFLTAKNMRVEKTLESQIKEVNPEVFNMLLNNLFINAIKHNHNDGGLIRVTLNDKELLIENTGAEKKIDKEAVFDRLEVYTTDSKSIGLGLSIIKKIIDYLRWTICYEFENGLHRFRIRFDEGSK